MGGNLFLAHPVQADDEDKVTIVSGTDAAEMMTVGGSIDAQAGLFSSENEKIEASATALDSQAGNDMIVSDAVVTSGADATVLLLQILDAKTQALAKSFGLVSGDGDDTLTSSGPMAITSVAGGAYAGALLFDSGDRKIDLSLNTEAGSTAMDAGDGDDTVSNDGALAANAMATSGGTVDQLTADGQGAVSLTSKSSAKAETTGIATGDGDDAIGNTNAIDSIATATSGALGMSLAAGENAEGEKAKTELDVSASAEATAVGIESDGDDAAEEDKEASPFGLEGLRVTYAKETTAVSGADSITNLADVQAVATATSGAGAASIDIAVDGTAKIKANSEAKAESIGISTGAAQDTIANIGDLNAVATATSGALSAAFQVGAPASDGDPPPTTDNTSDNNSSSQSDATATARAVGIASDGEGQFKTVSASTAITDTALVSRYQQSEGTLSDADQVANMGDIAAIATATADSESASIDIAAGGSVESKANATATSESVAIFTGGGDDEITNTGSLDAVATATSGALSLGLAVAESSTQDDDNPSNDSGSVKSETEATATATARGIDAEGDTQSKSVELDVDISRSGIVAGVEYRQEAATGNDTVDNQGRITAVATATSGSESASIDILAGGAVESKANATATSDAVAIFTGGGDDDIANTGALDAAATATSGALSVSLGVSESSSQDDDGGILDNLRERFWPTVHSEANATATASALGIDAEGVSRDQSTGGELALSRQDLTLQFSHVKTQLSGQDHVANDGAISAVATATSGAGAADIQINSDGTAAAEANSTATAQAEAIRTGGGDDTVDNTGTLAAVATATAGALSVSVSHADGDDTKARAEAKATSNAQATGIDTEGDAESRDVAFSLDLSGEGLHVNYNDAQEVANGNDTVVNQAAVSTVATASSGAAAVPVSIDGAAAADVTSRATSNATAITTGGGSDVIDNSGNLSAASQATSAALGLAFGQQTQSTGKTKVEVKAAAESTARAMGIATDGDAGDQSTTFAFALTDDALSSSFSKARSDVSGDDILTNTGNIAAVATATSGSASVGVAIDGAAAVDISSTSNAAATGVDTGGGDDTIDNQGEINAVATATSVALGVGVGVQNGSSAKASSNVEAAAKSEAQAIGITTDGDQQDTALEIELVITEDGLSAGYHQSKDPVTGDDHLTNTGAVNAVATATSGAGAVGVTTEGSARSDASATAKADARALDLGGGSDTVDNSGALTAVSTATAAAVEVSVSGKGTTIANNGIFSAGTTADARAVGIAGADAASAETLDITLDVDFNEVSAGFAFEKVVDGIDGDGDDTIINTAGITTVATATAPEVSVAVTSEGIAASLASTEATADATAIQSGHGDDTITTSGNLSATATATAAAVNVAVTGKGLAVAGNSVWDGGIKANATAAGIQSEGGEKKTLAIGVDASLEGVVVNYENTKELASGEDTVINDGNIVATAVAVAPEVSVAVSSQGMAASLSTSTATSEAFGIRTGDAGDDITNRGSITAVANADAVAVNVAVAPTGGSVAGNNFWDGGTKAEASAFGIDADGETASEIQTSFTADSSGAAFNYDHQETLASGDDVIQNDGDVTAVAVSVAPALSVAVTAEGVAAALSTATATSDARAIRGGDGDDIIENTGNLTAVSNADAFAVNVSVVPTGGVSAAGNNFWDGGNKAEALAIGIDGDGENYSTSEINVDVNGAGIGIERSSSNQMAGGDDRIVNSGDIGITAVAVSPSVATAVTVAGVSAAISTAKAISDARAIRGGDGSDTIENTGNLTVVSNADAAAVNVSVNAGGGVALASDAIWDGGTTAEAQAFGIDAEGDSSSTSTTTITIGASVDYDRDTTEEEATGDDVVNNQGTIDVLAVAVAPSVAVSVVGTGGVAGAFSTATAKADSTAISTGAGDDAITNSGGLGSHAVANADAVSVSVTGVGGVSVSGNNVWDGGTKSEAKSRGVDSGEGDDILENSGAIDTTATAVTANGSVSVTGVGGVAGAISTSTAKADSTAVDTGDGNDTITNAGVLDSVATAIAASVNVSVTGVGGVSVSGNNAWDGGTRSEAKSRGIDSSAGDDTLNNSGNISASATTVAASGAVSVVGVGGVSGAVSTSTAKSDAVAIAMGAGEDEVVNSGVLDASAFANADGLNVAVTGVGGVSVAGNNAWDGGTLAEARSAGIDGGDGEARITNSNSVTAASDAVSVAASLSYVTFGVPLAISTSTADAEAAAIRSGDADDQLVNSGALTADTDATAVTVNVAVTGAGVAGAGDSVWDGGTKAMATSVGMDARAGEDVIHNTGTIDVDADAVTSSNSVAFTVAGVSGAVSTSTATANAEAISGGDDDDIMHNNGALDSTANATAVSVSFAASGAGAAIAADAVWDGGTMANAAAKGMAGGQGDDTIQNTAGVDTTATSTTSSNSVAMTVVGVSGAASTSTSSADVAVIDGDEGNDTITNSGDLTGTASAGATSVSVAVTNMGATLATDAFWDGGTQAAATTRGISGGSGEDTIANTASITTVADARTTSAAIAASVGGGIAGAMAASTSTANATAIAAGDDDDRVQNDGDLTATAIAEANGVSVAVTTVGASLAGSLDSATTGNALAIGIAGGDGEDTLTSSEASAMTINASVITTETAVGVTALGGFADATANAIAIAEGIAIDGGADSDNIVNAGNIEATVAAEANSQAVSFTLAGAAVADANSEGHATATGLAGGAGADTIANSGSISLTATADAEGQSIAGTLAGFSVAGANATAWVDAFGLDGGAGEDTLVNEGLITGDVNVTTNARTINAALAGYALSEANATAAIGAVGIAGGADDDVIVNAASGDIDLLATADVYANQVTVAVAGAADGEANATPELAITGLAGGAGEDAILNEGRLTLVSRSKSESTGSSWTAAGSASSKSGNQVTNTAKGITGGAGDDWIANTGTIQVGPGEDATGDEYWMSSLITESFALGLAGATNAETTAFARTYSTGMDGEAGNDLIVNSGDVTVMATSRSDSTGGSFNLFGSGDAETDAGAYTAATGIEGGQGDDWIETGGEAETLIRVVAESALTMDGSSFSIGGGGEAGGKLAAETLAVGISGSEGQDTVRNIADIRVDAVSTLISQAGSDTIFGTSDSDLTSGANTNATGIRGGDGDDHVETTGQINVTATATISQDGSSYTFGGTGETGGALTAATRAVGISGDGGRDTIRNAGDITVSAIAGLDSSGDSETTFGTSEGGVTIGTVVESVGIEGGDGDDVIENTGRIDVSAGSTLTQAGASYAFGGTGATGGALEAATRAVGIEGGEGANHIRNAGVIDVMAAAALNTSGDSETTFGTSDGGISVGAIVEASGIAGGEDDDGVENLDLIRVRAQTNVTSQMEAYTFGGTSESDVAMSGAARADGIDGGDGANLIVNRATIDVEAVAALSASGGTSATFGGAGGSGSVAADATATGIGTGVDDDLIYNAGTIAVNGTADAAMLNNADAGWLVGDGDTVSAVRTSVQGLGVSAGDGDNAITNDGDVIVASEGVASAFSYASGAHLTWDGDGEAIADSSVEVAATGIQAGDGENLIANNGLIDVTARATTAKNVTTTIRFWSEEENPDPDTPPDPIATYTGDTLPDLADGDYATGDIIFWEDDPDEGIAGYVPAYRVVEDEDGEQSWVWVEGYLIEQDITLEASPTYAFSNGNGVTGTGTSSATGISHATAIGILAGNGNNRVFNDGEIDIEARPEALADVDADGDAWGDAIGTAIAEAYASAIGIDLGDGDNAIWNGGSVRVMAVPTAQAAGEVSGGDICIWFFGWWCGGGGDGIGTANALAEAEAYGIRVGDGDNQIINDGTLSVVADSVATATMSGDASPDIVVASTAYAAGIQAGNGHNMVVNNGTIDVAASAVGGTAEAIGIQTGGGDDTIVSSGYIVTAVEDVDGAAAGVTIATGAGNDVVALMPGAVSTGRVELGAGDDRLNLVESAVLNGDAMGGDDRDTIVFYGQGAYDGAIIDFETATKYDAGTYRLNSLPTMNELSIFDGVLQVQGDYAFDEMGSALMRIHLDGFGQLWVDGMADLGGSLSVLAEHRAYYNGEIFPIIQSEALVGTFPEVSLPEARQLLRFELNYNDEEARVEVMARTLPFRTVARNANERAIADYLDRIAPGATGEMSRVLGEFQTLQGRQFGEAFAGMSPASYGASTGAALNTARMYTQVVTKRMQSLWTGVSTKQADASSYGLDGILLAYNGPNASLGDLAGRKAQTDARRRWGAWANVYGQWATQDADDGYVGYDSDTYGIVLGMDYALSETWLAGLSFGYSTNDLNFDTNAGDGDIDSYFGSFYTGWYDDAFYLESVLTYGSQEFDNKRNVVVGATRNTARSDHDGNLYSAYLGSGYNFGDDVWQVGPFVSLQYLYLDEDSFEESGAGVLNLMVDDRQTDALISQLGVRAARYFDTGLGALVPELSLAWLYDFDIDDRVITSSFAGASGDAFSITGQEVEQNGVVVGAALTLMQANGIESSLTYSGEFRDGYDAHALIGQIRFAF